MVPLSRNKASDQNSNTPRFTGKDPLRGCEVLRAGSNMGTNLQGYHLLWLWPWPEQLPNLSITTVLRNCASPKAFFITNERDRSLKNWTE